MLTKLKGVLSLSDPYPSLWYEASCYIKTILGGILVIFGVFLLSYPYFLEFGIPGVLVTGISPRGKQVYTAFGEVFGSWIPGWRIILGILLILLGVLVFWRIKIVRLAIRNLR